MPYPKMSSDIDGNDDKYMSYSSLNNGSMPPVMTQPQYKPISQPLVQNIPSNNSTPSFNGYDNSDNYSSY
jgi:hypothetical protein